MLSSILTQLLAITILLLGAAFLSKKKRPTKYPPGPTPLPFIGNLHQLGRKPYKSFMKMSETYGNIFAIDFGSIRAVVLNDHKSIKEAFASDSFSGRPKLRPFLERGGAGETIARGVIFSDGKYWVEQRRFFSKTLREFGFGKRSMEGLIHDEIQELVETFQNQNGPIDMKHKFNGPVLNSIWNILTGQRFGKDDPVFKKIVFHLTEAAAEGSNTGLFYFFPTLSKIFPEWTGYNQFMLVLTSGMNGIKKTIEEHVQTFQEGNPRDFIDVYLEEIKKTDDTSSSFYGKDAELNLTIGLVDLFLAGVESASTTLNWAFLILSQKQDIQKRLSDEVHSFTGGTRLPSLTDRENMPYTEAFILEVMRFSAIFPLAMFHSTTMDAELQGHFIPEGTLIVPNVWGALRNVKTWGDPDEIRPERFILPDGKVHRYHEAFIPFSTGKRVCLGESLAKDELFLFLTTLVQKFHISVDSSRPVPSLLESTGLSLQPSPHRLVLNER